MLGNLIYKEFRLNVPVWLYLWLLFPVLVLIIPAWPFFIAFSWLFMVPLYITQFDKMNQDLAFAVSLPVPKSGIVTARTCTVVLFELATLVVGIPCAIGHHLIWSVNNGAGMNPNMAFFGVVALMYALFNTIYLPGTYKTPYRMLWPLLGGTLAAVIVGGLLTTLFMAVPSWAHVLNDEGLGHLGAQLVVLLVGLVLYAGLTVVAWRRAVATFEHTDL
ncbi:MAG: ABC-2 transporter permease [Propionibacteriaceae bacterium]|nr:ABC-2 transporter permease [Propionibacteriaceae bacterium]